MEHQIKRRTSYMSTEQFQGIGICYLCLEPKDEKDLSKEHIIPEFLSDIGQKYISKGTCRACNGTMNELFENAAAQNDYLIPRAVLELRRKKRGARTSPLAIPPVRVPRSAMASSTYFMTEDADEVKIPAKDMPFFTLLHYATPPGKLIPRDDPSHFGQLSNVIFDTGRGSQYPVLALPTEHVSGAGPLVYCKIAYLYAVAKLGPSAFEKQEILDLLFGRRQDIYNFFGGYPPENESEHDELHLLTIHEKQGYVCVNVHLFASWGMPPQEIVVGRALRKIGL